MSNTPNLVELCMQELDAGREQQCEGCDHQELSSEDHPYGDGSASESLVWCNVDWNANCPIVQEAVNRAQRHIDRPEIEAKLEREIERGEKMAASLLRIVK